MLPDLLKAEYPAPLDDLLAEAIRVGSWNGRVRRRRKDGSVVIVQAHWTLERNERGEPEAIVASIDESFIALDREWRFTYVNDRVVEQTGMIRGDLLGKVIWEIFPAAVNPKLWDEYHWVMENRQPKQF